MRIDCHVMSLPEGSGIAECGAPLCRDMFRLFQTNAQE